MIDNEYLLFDLCKIFLKYYYLANERIFFFFLSFEQEKNIKENGVYDI